MKKMRKSLEFDKNVATFRHSEGATRISLVTEGADGWSLRGELTSKYSEDSTAGDDSNEEKENDKKSSAEELVLTLNQECARNLVAKEEKALSVMLQHLDKKNAAGVRKELFNGGSVVA